MELQHLRAGSMRKRATFSNSSADSLWDEEASGGNADFTTLVSIVSETYSRGNFLKFSTFNTSINERELSPLEEGSDYALCSRKIKHYVPSALKSGQFDERNEKVVFKSPGRLFNGDGTAVSQRELRKILMEIQVLSHPPLSSHENIITLLGIKWHCEQLAINPAVQPQLVLELVERTLDDFMARHKDLSSDTKFRLAYDMVNGLEALHGCGLIHGDINPRNVFIKRVPTGEGVVQSRLYMAQLANFGNSFFDDEVPRRLYGGTPGFIPPEVVNRKEITNFKATDIYSLALTIWRTFIPDIDITSSRNKYTTEVDSLGNIGASLSETDVIEKSVDNVPDLLFVELLRPAISWLPEDRHLNNFKLTILPLLEAKAPVPQTKWLHNPRELGLFPNTTIHINYQDFNHANGLVKDQLVSSLERIAISAGDMRNSRALYELGICHISKFGDPNTLNASLGMRYILQAAEKGEIAAKGYANRLLEAYSESSGVSLTGLEPLDPQWLLEAAVEGFEAAYEEFTSKGSNLENKMEVLRLRWKKRCYYSLDEEIEEFKKQIIAWPRNGDPLICRLSSSEDTLLHWAAQLSLTEHLRFLLRDLSLDIDCRDVSGNTPLMAACAAGQLEATVLLIELGADVNVTNNQGETALHFIWRFCDGDAIQLLQELVKHNVDFDQESFLPHQKTPLDVSSKIATEKDPLPLLPGKAIERVAGRGRIVLVREFLRLKPLLEHDSSAVCCMIFWASVLNFVEIRDLITQHSADNKINGRVSTDRSLRNPGDSTWRHESRRGNFLGPVARGWLSATGTGWATPEIFWRMCCHGNQWEDKLQKTILSISVNSKKALCKLEDVLFFSCPMRHTAFSHTFLKLYIDEHRSSSARNDGRGHSCKKHRNPGQKRCGFDLDVQSNGPPLRVPLIERILFRNKRTLVQFAIILGNRELFSMLVKEFDVHVARPWSDTSSGSTGPPQRRVNSGKVYVNCYTLLALHSQDIWFAHEFRKMGIPIDHLGPSQGREIWLQRQINMELNKRLTSLHTPVAEYLPPLSHSLDMGFYQLATFLLDFGADLKETVSVRGSVFDRALSPPLITVDTVHFLFGQKGFYRKLDGTIGRLHTTLLPLHLFDQGNGRRVFDLIHNKYNQPLEPEPLQILSSVGKKDYYTFSSKLDLFLSCLDVFLDFIRIVFNPLTALVTYRNNSGVLKVGWTELGNKFLLYPDQPEQANRHELSLRSAWSYLVQEFPEADVSPRWRWTSILPHRSRSLLSLAITAPYTITEGKLWFIATSFYWESAKTLHPFQCCGCSCSLNSFHDLPQHCRMDTPIKKVLGIYECTKRRHKPSFIDVFLWNDYDLLPSTYADTLFNLGYRHSFLYFVELRIVSSILMLLFLLFLAIYPTLMASFHFRHAIPTFIVFFTIPASFGIISCLWELISSWRHWCESGNFLWPMLTGKKRYTGYSFGQAFGAIMRVFVWRSDCARPEEAEPG